MDNSFDIYYLYAQSGDRYLGVILAGLDPNAADFAILLRTLQKELKISIFYMQSKYFFQTSWQ